MPNKTLKSLVKNAPNKDVNLEKAEQYWDEAKKQAKKAGLEEDSDNFYAYVMSIVKRRLGYKDKEESSMKNKTIAKLEDYYYEEAFVGEAFKKLFGEKLPKLLKTKGYISDEMVKVIRQVSSDRKLEKNIINVVDSSIQQHVNNNKESDVYDDKDIMNNIGHIVSSIIDTLFLFTYVEISEGNYSIDKKALEKSLENRKVRRLILTELSVDILKVVRNNKSKMSKESKRYLDYVLDERFSNLRHITYK